MLILFEVDVYRYKKLVEHEYVTHYVILDNINNINSYDHLSNELGNVIQRAVGTSLYRFEFLYSLWSRQGLYN